MARNKYPEETIERILEVSEKLFMEKGYEKTTIKDIIDALGNLSKGAIYHHFKSKEDIVDAVISRMYGGVDGLCNQIATDKSLTGLEKIRQLFYITLENPVQETLMKTLPNLLNNPKLVVIQLKTTIDQLAHGIIEGFVREGIEDGSIETAYPRELSEVIALLVNIWLNPLMWQNTGEELYRKCMFLKELTESLGVNIIDERIVNAFERLGKP